MNSKITFATFDPLFRETPERCVTCSVNPPAFHYEYFSGVEELEPEVGFCCATCAPDILAKLASAECQAWQDEEAALQTDDIDVSDLHRWRVAAFQR
jgi:hypothetical protein